MFVRDCMTPDPKTIESDVTVDDAFALMRALKIRHLPVVRGHRVIGIVSWTDLMRATPPERVGVRARATQAHIRKAEVADIMTADPVTTDPDVPVELAARTLREHKIGALPVVERGLLVGIVTESDLFDVLIDMLGGDLRGARVSIRLTRGLADVGKVVDVLRRADGIDGGLALVVRLGNGARRGYLRLATPSPLAVVDRLATAGLELSEFRVEPPVKRRRVIA
jgi:acetoin utilization protein AcuB